MNIDHDIAARLAERKLLSVRDVFERTPFELMELLDLSHERVAALLHTIASAVLPPPQTALSMLRRSQEHPAHLRTMLAPLDTALLGGLPAGSVTELVGPAGLGKTQFCLGMCIVGCLDRLAEAGRVLYIDTERKFSVERLMQIAETRFSQNLAGPGAMLAMLDRILVQSPESSESLVTLLEGLEIAVPQNGIKLVIIDSIAALARTDYGVSDIVERQLMLGRQASKLKFLAESFRIPVLVTNQVTTAVSGSGGLTAALGPTWAHAVNTRLIMAAQQDLETGAQLRVLTVAKSPIAPLTSVVYAITKGGVEWLENAHIPQAPAGSVLEMVIANYQAYEIEGTAHALW